MSKEVYISNLKDYLSLLSSYLNNKEMKEFKINESNISFFLSFSKKHSLTAVLYKAAVATKAAISKEYLSKLEEAYFANLRKSVLFEKEREDLYKYLNNNQIDFIPLKGLVLKDYYLDPYTREFADNDILFSNKDDAIKKFFVNRGYKVEVYKKAAHDVYLKKPIYPSDGNSDTRPPAGSHTCLRSTPDGRRYAYPGTVYPPFPGRPARRTRKERSAAKTDSSS